MKKSLDRASNCKKISEESGESKSGSFNDKRASNRRTPSTSRVYEVVCIFSDKTSKYRKNENCREKLVKCVDLRDDEKIRKAAIAKSDVKMMAIVSRELVAAEAHYHRSCYKDYTRERKDKNNKEGSFEESSEYEAVESQAYEMLCQHIREDLMENPRVIKFTDLIDKLSFYMMSLGILNVNDSTKNHLTRRLETSFGSLLHFEKEQDAKSTFGQIEYPAAQTERHDQAMPTKCRCP